MELSYAAPTAFPDAQDYRCCPGARCRWGYTRIVDVSIDRQPSIASYRFFCNSSQVSPWVAQPGIAGTSAQYPPSSALCTTTWKFIDHLDSEGAIQSELHNALTMLSDIFLASPSSIIVLSR